MRGTPKAAQSPGWRPEMSTTVPSPEVGFGMMDVRSPRKLPPSSPSKKRGRRVEALYKYRLVMLVVLVLVAITFVPEGVFMQAAAYGYAAVAFELAFLWPPARRECAYERYPAALETFRTSKVVLATASDNHNFTKNDGWTEADNALASANKAAYAARHGYAFRDVDFQSLTDRRGSWGKIVLVRQLLNEFDIVAFMDSDVAILQPDVKIEDMLGEGKDITVTEDKAGICAGSVIVRNSTWSQWFFAELHRQDWLVDAHHITFKWDQRAWHYLLQTPQWKAFGIGGEVPYPVHPDDFWSTCAAVRKAAPKNWVPCPKPLQNATDQELVWANSGDMYSHLHILPQCALNAQLRWAFSRSSQESWETAQYVPGDFALHAAGYRYSFKGAVFHMALLQAELAGGFQRFFAYLVLLAPVFLGIAFIVLRRHTGRLWQRSPGGSLRHLPKKFTEDSFQPEEP